MQIQRVLDKKLLEKQESYLIQWLGQHRTQAVWKEKSSLLDQYPQAAPTIEQYDKEINNLMNKIRREKQAKLYQINASKILNDQAINSEVNQAKTPRKRRRNQDQLLSIAKRRLEISRSNVQISAKDLVIHISTQEKPHCYWAFGDRIKHILRKEKGQPLYLVIWQDGHSSMVSEEQLLDKQCEKLCKFLESMLLKKPSSIKIEQLSPERTFRNSHRLLNSSSGRKNRDQSLIKQQE